MSAVISKDDVFFITTTMNSQVGAGISSYVDRETSEVITVIDEEDSYAENELRYLPIPQGGSSGGYQDMVDFIDTVEDSKLRDLLEVAIDGQGAFSRFKNVLHRAEYELELARWYTFRDKCEYDRGVAWLLSEGLRVEE
jgi:hypothetical protein